MASTVLTGLPRLDADIDAFMDFRGSEREQKVIEAVKDSTIDGDKLSELVPPFVLRLAASLATEAKAHGLASQTNGEANEELEQLRKYLLSNYSALLGRADLDDLAWPESEGTELESTAPVTKVSYIFSWRGNPPYLRPAATLLFRNISGSIVLETVCDWDDLAFLTGSLTEILAELMEHSRELQKKSLVYIADNAKQGIQEQINRLHSSLERIKAASPDFGLD